MTTYPTGAMQNFSTPNMPPDVRPVSEDRWFSFVPEADSKKVFTEVQKLSPDAKMGVATQGMYSQYLYFQVKDGTLVLAPVIDVNHPPAICVRMIAGEAPADDGSGTLIFIEYAGSLSDGRKSPRPFIDTYPAGGNAAQLKCRRVTEKGGQLYWA